MREGKVLNNLDKHKETIDPKDADKWGGGGGGGPQNRENPK